MYSRRKWKRGKYALNAFEGCFNLQYGCSWIEFQDEPEWIPNRIKAVNSHVEQAAFDIDGGVGSGVKKTDEQYRSIPDNLVCPAEVTHPVN